MNLKVLIDARPGRKRAGLHMQTSLLHPQKP
jgi:hypothetical protein